MKLLAWSRGPRGGQFTKGQTVERRWGGVGRPNSTAGLRRGCFEFRRPKVQNRSDAHAWEKNDGRAARKCCDGSGGSCTRDAN